MYVFVSLLKYILLLNQLISHFREAPNRSQYDVLYILFDLLGSSLEMVLCPFPPPSNSEPLVARSAAVSIIQSNLITCCST